MLELMSEYSLSQQELEQRVARLEAAATAKTVAAAAEVLPPPEPAAATTEERGPERAATANAAFELFVRDNRDAIEDFIRDFEEMSGTALCARTATENLWEQLPTEEKEIYQKLARKTNKKKQSG